MPEVWTHDNLSRHFMPRSDAVVQLFILLCSIVSFVLLFNQQCEITDFLEDQQISLKKTDITQTAKHIVQKCKCKSICGCFLQLYLPICITQISIHTRQHKNVFEVY